MGARCHPCPRVLDNGVGEEAMAEFVVLLRRLVEAGGRVGRNRYVKGPRSAMPGA
jgi:hypothetical protein